MSRRRRSSAAGGMQRVASLLALAVVAGMCSVASCFVISSAAVGRRRHHTDMMNTHTSTNSARRSINRLEEGGAPGGGGTVRRQRSSSLHAAAAGAQQAGDGDVSSAATGRRRSEGNAAAGAAAAAAAAVATAWDAEAAAAEGAPSMSSQSTAPARTEIPTDVAVVGAPQQVVEKEYSIEAILKELAEIQNQGPKNVCVLGTRHCSYLHQQIIELLAYALVLSGNHVFTSGAMGTNAATIRGALRAERKELLTVVLPQSLEKQSPASRELIQKVRNVVTNPINDHLPLDAASRLCNSDLLSRTEQLICFAFHDSKTIIETTKEARSLNMIVTELYLD